MVDKLDVLETCFLLQCHSPVNCACDSCCRLAAKAEQPCTGRPAAVCSSFAAASNSQQEQLVPAGQSNQDYPPSTSQKDICQAPCLCDCSWASLGSVIPFCFSVFVLMKLLVMHAFCLEAVLASTTPGSELLLDWTLAPTLDLHLRYSSNNCCCGSVLCHSSVFCLSVIKVAQNYAGRAAKCPFAVLLKHHCPLPQAVSAQQHPDAAQEPLFWPEMYQQSQLHTRHHTTHPESSTPAADTSQVQNQHKRQQHGEMHAPPTQTSAIVLPAQDTDQQSLLSHSDAAPRVDLGIVRSEANSVSTDTHSNPAGSAVIGKEATMLLGHLSAMMHNEGSQESADELALQLESGLFTQDLIIADSDPEDEQQFLLQSCSQCFVERDQAVDACPIASTTTGMGTNPDLPGLDLNLSPMDVEPDKSSPGVASHDETVCTEAPPIDSTLPDSCSAPVSTEQDAIESDRATAPSVLMQQQLQPGSNALRLDSPLPSALPNMGPHQACQNPAKEQPPVDRTTAADNRSLQPLLQSHTPHAAVTSFLWAVLRSIVPQARSSTCTAFMPQLCSLAALSAVCLSVSSISPQPSCPLVQPPVAPACMDSTTVDHHQTQSGESSMQQLGYTCTYLCSV